MNLLIDTHLNDVIILLEKDNKIIKEKKVYNENQNSRVIMPSIKKILKKNKPNSIIVVNGPGSFTGVRLGVTVAKTLAYTMKVPIRTVSYLECMAVSTDSNDKTVAFSDNNGYYIGIFSENNELYGDYEYLTNAEYKEFTDKYNVNDDVEIDYLKVINFALSKDPVNAHEVNPIYIKKLDVEK